MNIISLLFSFKGCINRLQYFFSTILANTFIGIIILVMNNYIVSKAMEYEQLQIEPDKLLFGFLFTIVLGLVTLNVWVALALAAKRFRDIAASGWFSLLMLIPFVNFIVFFLLSIIPGKRDGNKYCPEMNNQEEVKEVVEVDKQDTQDSNN